MASGSTVQQGTEHTNLHAVDAPRYPLAQQNTTTITFPENIQTRELKTSGEIASPSDRDVGVAEGPELHKPTKSEMQESTQAHVTKAVDSHEGSPAEADGYYPMTLDVSKLNARKR
jgi:hypothetical protein